MNVNCNNNFWTTCHEWLLLCLHRAGFVSNITGPSFQIVESYWHVTAHKNVSWKYICSPIQVQNISFYHCFISFRFLPSFLVPVWLRICSVHYVCHSIFSAGYLALEESSLWHRRQNERSKMLVRNITCESLSPSLVASSFLSGLQMYCCLWNILSRPFLWTSEKTALLSMPRVGLPRIVPRKVSDPGTGMRAGPGRIYLLLILKWVFVEVWTSIHRECEHRCSEETIFRCCFLH